MSTFGCVQTFVDANTLELALRSHMPMPSKKYLDVSGVVAWMIKPEESLCGVAFSTLRLLMDSWVQQVMGYGLGQEHVDHTFKLLQEQVPFLVTSHADIGQHVHPSMLGPTTHMTEAMTTAMLTQKKAKIDWLVKMIFHNTDDTTDPHHWPAYFTSELRYELCDKYKPFLDALVPPLGLTNGEAADSDAVAKLISFAPARGMADAADALGNTLEAVYGADVAMCWVHVWMAVKRKAKLLNNKSDETARELYTDLVASDSRRGVILTKWRVRSGQNSLW